MEEDQALLFFIPEFIGIPFREKSSREQKIISPFAVVMMLSYWIIGKQPGPVMAV